MLQVLKEMEFKTARSGGKGGQNVNKVETMVEGYFHIGRSALLTPEQKALIYSKLANKITDSGYLQVKSQVHRSQLSNKQEVIEKLNLLLNKALIVPKKRKPTRPGKAAKERRITGKKITGEIKAGRKKIIF